MPDYPNISGMLAHLFQVQPPHDIVEKGFIDGASLTSPSNLIESRSFSFSTMVSS